MIRKELRKVAAEHTIFDDPATVVLVFMLAEETQTRWFLFLDKHPEQPQGVLFKKWMGIENTAAANWQTQIFATKYIRKINLSERSDARANSLCVFQQSVKGRRGSCPLCSRYHMYAGQNGQRAAG